MMITNIFLESYEKLIKNGILSFNSSQRQVVLGLSTLLPIKKANSYHPFSSFFSFLFFNKSNANKFLESNSNSKQGFYLYGSVGTGKSMLMDLFYKSIDDFNQNNSHNNSHFKHRIHYNSFMTEIHSRIFKIRHDYPTMKNPMKHLLKELYNDYQILCLDEFQVVDIADAMILRSFIEGFLNLGGFLAITSNRVPNELYKNGIQRSSFLPCIDLLERRLMILNLDSGQDFRQRKDELFGDHFLFPINLENLKKFNEKFEKLSQGNVISDMVIFSHDRPIHVSRSFTLSFPCDFDTFSSLNHRVAYFTFAELCDATLSASDYQIISQNYKIIFVEGSKSFTKWEQRDELRRFITMIDVFYDMKVRLAMLMESDLDNLFQFKSKSSNLEKKGGNEKRMEMERGNFNNSAMESSLFTGEEEEFAIKRTISRLKEMQTSKWWKGENIESR